MNVSPPGQAGRGHLRSDKATRRLRADEQPEPGRIGIGAHLAALLAVGGAQTRQLLTQVRPGGLDVLKRQPPGIGAGHRLTPGRSDQPGRHGSGCPLPRRQEGPGELEIMAAPDAHACRQQRRVDAATGGPHPARSFRLLDPGHSPRQVILADRRASRRTIILQAAQQPGRAGTCRDRDPHTVIVCHATDSVRASGRCTRQPADANAPASENASWPGHGSNRAARVLAAGHSHGWVLTRLGTHTAVSVAARSP